jgi:hypothetical protein
VAKATKREKRLFQNANYIVWVISCHAQYTLKLLKIIVKRLGKMQEEYKIFFWEEEFMAEALSQDEFDQLLTAINVGVSVNLFENIEAFEVYLTERRYTPGKPLGDFLMKI